MAGNPPRGDVRFFTMGDSGYFLGAVALVNSLRLVGHYEPITFLDLGLTLSQRGILAQQCNVVDIDCVPGAHPFTFQPYPHVLEPSGICVIVDSDVIVTHRLDALIDAAAAGGIAAFPDRIERTFAVWETIFQLRSPLQAGLPYVNSGLLAFDADRHREFLSRWWHLCRSLDVEYPRTLDNPTAFADQDALNALLMSEYAPCAVAMSAPRLALGALELKATQVEDIRSLVCSLDSCSVAALHSVLYPKPWTNAAGDALLRNAYLTCLRRCLVGSDLVIEIDDGDLPTWLRRGTRATFEAWVRHIVYRARCRSDSLRNRFAREPTKSDVPVIEPQHRAERSQACDLR